MVMSNQVVSQALVEMRAYGNGNWLKSIGLTVPIAFVLYLFLLSSGLQADATAFVAKLIAFLFCVSLFFLMQFTGKIYQFRRILFVTMSVCLLISLSDSHD